MLKYMYTVWSLCTVVFYDFSVVEQFSLDTGKLPQNTGWSWFSLDNGAHWKLKMSSSYMLIASVMKRF